MRPVGNLNSGWVEIREDVLAEIVATTLAQIRGVRLIAPTFAEKFFSFFGEKLTPGVEIFTSKNGEVNVEVTVNVRYGLNIPLVAKEIQDKVKEAVEQTAEVHLSEVTVNVQGIERDKI